MCCWGRQKVKQKGLSMQAQCATHSVEISRPSKYGLTAEELRALAI